MLGISDSRLADKGAANGVMQTGVHQDGADCKQIAALMQGRSLDPGTACCSGGLPEAGDVRSARIWRVPVPVGITGRRYAASGATFSTPHDEIEYHCRMTAKPAGEFVNE
jgi:hypothetical protein